MTVETLGEFYRDNILNQPNLIEVKMPRGEGEIRIEQEIFGWRLYRGKKYIECKSEAIARYLKVFLEARQSYIRMPQDEEYLQSIVPELEHLKKCIDEIVNDYAEGILNQSKRERLLSLVWYKLMHEGYEAEEKLDAQEQALT